ncbi:MAG: hypothetical protein O8C60_03770 [Candidatus Methanoperedens sp.]|nr:hypothetical protein [Candidatus Methanoperedens sp.]
MKIKLIVEDFYGGPFFIDVIQRLKEANLVNKNLIIPKPKHLPADCNQKLDEILEFIDNKVDRIIIVLDADGPRNFKDRYERANSHIPKGMKTPVKIVLAEYEIEEWICISKNLKWKQSKPSEELNFDKLQKNCRSFKAFLNALTP